MHGNMNVPMYIGKAAHSWWALCSGAYASKPFFKEFLARKGWQIPSTACYMSLSWLVEKLSAFNCLLKVLLVLSVYSQWLILWANFILKTWNQLRSHKESQERARWQSKARPKELATLPRLSTLLASTAPSALSVKRLKCTKSWN